MPLIKAEISFNFLEEVMAISNAVLLDKCSIGTGNSYDGPITMLQIRIKSHVGERFSQEIDIT